MALSAKTELQAWRLIDSGPCSGSENMAVDEVLLERAVTKGGPPVLRLYSWDPPAVSLGRFQVAGTAVREDVCRRLGFPVVRRITGGRAVLHFRELTYCIVSRADNPLFPPSVLGTYRVIAGGLLAGLAHLGIHAEVVSRSNRHAALVEKKAKAHACFASPSWYEILVNGKKIAGSAQRRVSGAFLQHGSVLIEYEPALESSVIRGGESAGAVTSITAELGREASLDEVKRAFSAGFSGALGIEFIERTSCAHGSRFRRPSRSSS